MSTKFREKPVVVEALQWRTHGDHPMVRVYAWVEMERGCKHCGQSMTAHGWVDTLEGGHIVCPGDWVITGVKGEHYPCKPDVFERTYEPA